MHTTRSSKGGSSGSPAPAPTGKSGSPTPSSPAKTAGQSEVTTSKPTILKTFYVPIYNVRVIAVVAEDIYAEFNSLRRYFPGYGDDNAFEGFVVENTKTGTFGIFLKHSWVFSYFAHEVHHLTNKILLHIGHTATFEHDEPSAYLCQWLTRKLLTSIQ